MKSLYDFKVNELSGRQFDFSLLRGKKVMVVNTASECGFTNQYKQLQELYEEFGPEKFVVIGFPCNDFGEQEPGTSNEIGEFCERNYGVTFPMMQKVHVTGPEQHEVYQWLTDKDQNGVADIDITWNFQKLLIDEQGRLVKSIAPGTDPVSPEIMSWLTQTQLF